MGNLTSSTRSLLERSTSSFGSLNQSNENLSASSRNGVGVPEFFSLMNRRVALTAILFCQLFDWISFAIVTVWIPQSLQLNVFFFTGDGDASEDDYYSYMYRVQIISVMSLVILYSSAWISGILMDAWWKKTKFVLAAMMLVCVGYIYISALIITIGDGISCTNTSNNNTNDSYICHLDDYTLCLSDHEDGTRCLDVYIGWVCAVSALGAVIRTALPALGGDQISERNGVRVFYAQFYWCQKAGEALSALLCVSYLYAWSNFANLPTSQQEGDINSYKNDYVFLFYGWAASISVACFISLIALLIVICGNLTRQVNPDVSVIEDTYLIWVEAFSRRKDQDEDSNFLDTAKRSKGGSFADQPVEDRRSMAKFSFILLLLVPVAFATTLPTLPILPCKTTAPIAVRLEETFKDTSVTVIVNLIRHLTACIAIPTIHKICSLLARKGRPLTLLNRIVFGHVFMITALAVEMVTRHFTKEYRVEYLVSQMILLGICNAFIYTTGYELTMLSAPRAMQGTAMGMFYLMDGIANALSLAIITNITLTECATYTLQHFIINGVGGVVPVSIALVLLVVCERKWNLGLTKF